MQECTEWWGAMTRDGMGSKKRNRRDAKEIKGILWKEISEREWNGMKKKPEMDWRNSWNKMRINEIKWIES